MQAIKSNVVSLGVASNKVTLLLCIYTQRLSTTLNSWINVHVYVYFFEQIFYLIQALFGSVRLSVFGSFHPIRTLFGPVRLLKSSDFVSSYTEEQSIAKFCCLVWNIKAESRFYSIENALVGFERFPFVPSAKSSGLNKIKTWCLMVSRFSRHRVRVLMSRTAMLWWLTRFRLNETVNII